MSGAKYVTYGVNTAIDIISKLKPKYSMENFKAQMSKIIHSQSVLQILLNQIEKGSVRDTKLGVFINISDDDVKKIKELKKLLNPAVFTSKEKFNWFESSEIESKIVDKLHLLKQAVFDCKAIVDEFEKQKSNYEVYKQYIGFYNNTLDTFRKNNKEFLSHYNTLMPAEYKEDKSSLPALPEFKATCFEYAEGFTKILDTEKKHLLGILIQQESELRGIIASDLNNELMTGADNAIHLDGFSINPVIPEPVKASISDIEILIGECTIPETADTYRQKLNEIKYSINCNDVFYYNELHDFIIEKEHTARYKESVNNVLKGLSELRKESLLSYDISGLTSEALRLIEMNKIKASDFSRFKKNVESFYKKRNQALLNEEIKRREARFVKSQIIMQFESMGYEVVDDMTVVDFEKKSDIYMNIPGQENLMLLRFKDDGSFRYVFQIPENKDKLSVEATKLKLHEMNKVCSDFKNVLNDLQEMGVDTNIESERAVVAESLVSIPEQIIESLQSSKQSENRKEAIKKLYIE